MKFVYVDSVNKNVKWTRQYNFPSIVTKNYNIVPLSSVDENIF